MTKSEDLVLSRLRNRDPEAMQEAVLAHTSHIYRACFGLGFGESDAEDLTQSIWLTFFDVISKFEGRSSLRTFLFGILYNKASELRRQSRRAEPTGDIETLLDERFDEHGHWIPTRAPLHPERFLEASRTREALSKCLELLPLTQRMAFVLKEVQEESSLEICAALELTPTHLGVLLFRARNQLRGCVERKAR